MRVKKNWLVSVLSFSLALCITLSSLLSTGIGQGTMVAKADTSAKSRVQTFIGLAAGKSGTSLPDIGQLTQDELQFLGVYLSNFYVPFSTELGANVSNEETLKQQKEAMVEALKLNLNFNETVASELVDNIIGLARSNNRELEFRVSVDYLPSSQSAYKTLQGFDVNYYTFLSCMTGGMFDNDKYDITITNKALIVFDDVDTGTATNIGYDLGSSWYGTDSEDKKVVDPLSAKDALAKLFEDLYINNSVPENCKLHFEEGWAEYSGGKCTKVNHLWDSSSKNIDYAGCSDDDIDVYISGLIEGDYCSCVRDYERMCSQEIIDIYWKYREGVTPSEVLKKPEKFKYNYGYFGYVDNAGNFTPVFDCGFNGYGTASMDAFSLCWSNLSTENGYGSAFFDFTSSEISGKSFDDVISILDSYSDDIKFKASAYSSKMYVDCFGDILVMGNNHQYVGIPGCLNPYTWVGVDNYGNDSHYAGEIRYAINAYDISNDLAHFRVAYNSPGLADRDCWDNIYASSEYMHKIIYTWSDNYYIGNYAQLDDGFWESYGDFVASKLWGGNPDSDAYFIGMPMNIVRGSNKKAINDINSVAAKWVFGDGTDLMAKIESGAGGVKPWMCFSNIGGFSAITEYTWDGNYILLPFPNRPDDTSDSLLGRRLDILVSDKMCYIDNLGAFGFDSSNSDVAYDAIVFSSYFSSDVDKADWSTKIQANFSSLFSKVDTGSINSYQMSDICAVSLYTTYAVAGLYKDDDSKADTIGELGIRMNREGLPSIDNTPLLISDSYADDLLKTEITNMIYYALKPDSTDYVKIAIKNKVNAILVDWHNDMVGSQGMGYTTGTTYYRTNYGYVTTPDLSEMQWTNSLLNLYDTAIPILIIFMVISMLIAFVTGTMSFQKAVMGTIIFAAFLLVPVNAINYVCQTCNSFTNRIYGDKFVYWALVQEETYGTALDTAASGDSYENYIKTLYAANEMNQGGESIVLKWQAPKKMASLMLSSDDKSLLDNLQGNLLNSSLLSNALSGEAYLDGASQYMYRDYSDLANFSRFIHHSTNSGSPIKRTTANGTFESGTWNTIHGVHPDDAYRSYVQAGYTNGSQSWTDSSVLTSMYSDVYNDATKDSIIEDVRVGNISQGEYVGINQDLFNVSLAYFNNTKQKTEGGEEDLTYESAIRNNLSSNNTDIDEWLVKYDESEYNSLMVYGVMSESPYYYFSWGMYDNGMSTSANAGGGYKTMLLSDQDGGYFYNMSGNGELKDFMNMRNLFYHVIPYLKQGNDLVRAWDDRYGIFIYDGVPTDEGYLDDPTIQGDDSLKYKYWHNLNVARLYTVYTPWLDLMYDCDYAKPCYVKVMGTKYYVEDPLNPWCYPAERPMIFSESEMYDYGLTEGDLTEVERKILKFNRESQEDMYELLNYYNFSDLSLNTAAAMQCTFNFNRIFSETGFFSNNINLYPQSFEIKDFSYDAFLRFILSTTTGESLAGSTDFYGDLVKKSSTTTAILLLVCDILSQYVVPFAKVVFLIAIFVSSVLLITVTVFRVDPEFRFVGKLAKGIAVPLLEFCAVTMGFAYVVSLFMGVGNNAVTQSDNVSISLGDPNMVLIAMCVLNLVCVVLYVKLLINLWNDIKTHASLIKNHVSGLVGGAILMGVGGIKSSMSGMGSGSSGVSGYNETGTGRESARATTRASKSAEDINNASSNGVANERISDSRRTTITNSDGVSDSKRSKDIENTINQGRDKVNRTVGTAVETSGKVVGKTTEAVGGLAGDTVRGVGSMTGAGLKGAGAVAGGVTKGVGSVAGAGVKGVGHVTSAVLTATGVGAAAIPVIEGVTNTVGNGIKSATNTAGNIQKKAGQVAGDATKSTTSAIGSGVKTVSKGAGNAIEGLGGSAGDSIRNS